MKVPQNPVKWQNLSREVGGGAGEANYCPQRSRGNVIFSEACVKNSVHGGEGGMHCRRGGGVCGGGRQMHGRGACVAGGVCMAGGLCGGGMCGRAGGA